MRLLTKVSLIAAAMISLSACQKEAAAPAAPVLDTDAAKQSYAMGVSVGKYLNSAVEEHKKLGLPLASDTMVRGVQDALAGKAALTDEEVQKVMTALDEQFRAKQAEVAKAKAAETIAKGEAFLAENAKKEGVKVTESGLQYEVITAADGPKPKAEEKVRVKYKGTFIDGTEFDSTDKSNGGEPVEFQLNQVIPGWTEGVQLMGVGSKFKFTIPSALGYGDRDVGPIPANSVLQFEVELLGIVAEEAAPAGEAAKK
ncbi:FKBP-type peptidyl-prolyl cis-trans isomerase [Rheinheimera sp. 4Y26]|uniref:FKBP-type peptidyl-prolyl cis-trans isomerase n=1 Tax=Rheinheimera sp. 4Y26 TaxID=2977811 RepID=UPI0021B094D0|nr:FKBP-type peptidyl-prolyl cis-trans isomerase [Rheinheimera sp. 4Y26]MCT6701263.1 FKBP-type peptidyl-prolyl cis-trans isomerase [Rheinheimera sp. 4Y26]